MLYRNNNNSANCSLHYRRIIRSTTDVKANPLKAEYLLLTHIGGLLRDGKYTVKVLETKDKWFGVTYKEDKEAVVQSFKMLIEDGVYREELYSDL